MTLAERGKNDLPDKFLLTFRVPGYASARLGGSGFACVDLAGGTSGVRFDLLPAHGCDKLSRMAPISRQTPASPKE
jgi:hypothetical protein